MGVIKRYANRKLYDTQTGRYVTLEEIGEAIQRGEEVTIVDHATGADLTAVTLMQVIYEREKNLGGRLPKAFLTGFIQTGSNALHSLRDGLVNMLDSNQTIEQEIRRRLKVLADDGLIAVSEMQRLIDLLLAPRFREKPEAAGEEISQEAVDDLLNQINSLEAEIARLREKQP